MKCPPQHGLFSSCFQSKSSAHVQHKLSVLWKEYRAGTRSVDGLLRACFLHVGLIFVSVTSLPYNRQIMQTRIIYCKTAYFMAIVPVSDM